MHIHIHAHTGYTGSENITHTHTEMHACIHTYTCIALTESTCLEPQAALQLPLGQSVQQMCLRNQVGMGGFPKKDETELQSRQFWAVELPFDSKSSILSDERQPHKSKDLNSDLEHSCSKAQRPDVTMHTWTHSSGEVESGGPLGFADQLVWPSWWAQGSVKIPTLKNKSNSERHMAWISRLYIDVCTHLPVQLHTHICAYAHMNMRAHTHTLIYFLKSTVAGIVAIKFPLLWLSLAS